MFDLNQKRTGWSALYPNFYQGSDLIFWLNTQFIESILC